MEPQKYLKSEKFTNEEVQLLSRLRSRTLSVKDNVKGMHPDIQCSLGCPEIETQKHILECKPLLDKSNSSQVVKTVEYSDIFGNVNRQKLAVVVYAELLKIREELIQV